MKLEYIQLDKIRPNPFQPRMKFDENELQELADNISKHGMIEPIVVTPKGDKYMIVAGERRWRANKSADKERVYAIVKDYKTDADIKRDSLVENEMRENLKNSEFRAFLFSLAKSLGEPYFNKGYVNPTEISKYLLGKDEVSMDTSSRTLHRKIHDTFKIQKKASVKVKKLFEEDKLDRRTATTIASIPDKQTQDELAELAKHKSTTEIRQEVARHNFEQQAKEVKEKVKKETDEQKKYNTEKNIVVKFTNKINSWNDSINHLVTNLKTNRDVLPQFSHKSRMEMLDVLKPMKRDLERALHLTSKLMELIAK